MAIATEEEGELVTTGACLPDDVIMGEEEGGKREECGGNIWCCGGIVGVLINEGGVICWGVEGRYWLVDASMDAAEPVVLPAVVLGSCF